MTYQTIAEGDTIIETPVEEVVHSKMPVFYNPVMKLNRDLSIDLLNAIDNEDMQICDLLAGTGIRSVRFLRELKKGKIKNITINDINKNSKKLIKKNLKLNKKHLNKAKIYITKEDANLFLLNSTGFDYIDIDPFGCPNAFLDAATRRTARNGILAVTATDTSSLAGTFPTTCMRKYWAKPKLDSNKHETGLRILIRKCQLVASQYDRALTPIFSYSHEHYMRVFFRVQKSKTKTDSILKQHKTINEVGPMWTGQLWDKELTKKMHILDPNNDFLNIINQEAQIPNDNLLFFDIHNLCKQHKLQVPKYEHIKQNIEKLNYQVSKTHFTEDGIRSNIEEKELIKILKKKN